MLLTLLLAAYSLPRTFVASSAWEGTVTIDEGGCVDGDVELLLTSPDSEGVVQGTYRYESRGHRDGWYEASYTMRGSWRGPRLRLSQDAVDVQVERQSTNWCMGQMDLKQQGARLEGEWAAENCGCAGTVLLTPR